MWLQLGAVLALLAMGFWARDMYQAWSERRGLEKQLDEAEKQPAILDEVLTEQIKQDAAIDAGVARVNNKRREIKSRDEAYREYLDRPLPEPTLQLYRDAAAAVRAARDPGADGAGPEAEQGNH
jgi:hypothetical protein